MVTRFEYANMFHTVTDWYAAYVASRVTGLPNRPHLVFVDGHCMVRLLNFTSLLYCLIVIVLVGVLQILYVQSFSYKYSISS